MDNELIEGVISNTDESDFFEIELKDVSYELGEEICKILGINPNEVTSIRIEAGGLGATRSPVAIIRKVKRT